jgi:membrane protein implicated in regulation of membrane protease activity
MELFGLAMETIYLYLLIGGLILLVVILLVGEVLESVIDGLDFLPFGPSETVLFTSFFGGVGWVFESYSEIVSMLVILIAACIALIVTFVVSIFVLKPLKRLESSATVSSEDLIGRFGTVTMEISDGVGSPGEVTVDHELGIMSRTALSEDGKGIPLHTKVLIVDVRNSRFIVSKPLADILNK